MRRGAHVFVPLHIPPGAAEPMMGLPAGAAGQMFGWERSAQKRLRRARMVEKELIDLRLVEEAAHNRQKRQLQYKSAAEKREVKLARYAQARQQVMALTKGVADMNVLIEACWTGVATVLERIGLREEAAIAMQSAARRAAAQKELRRRKQSKAGFV